MNIPMMALTAMAVRNTYQAVGNFYDDDDDFDDDDGASGASVADRHLPVCRITLEAERYKEALSRISAGK